MKYCGDGCFSYDGITTEMSGGSVEIQFASYHVLLVPCNRRGPW